MRAMPSAITTFRVCLTALPLLAVGLAPLAGQPASATFRPALAETFAFKYSWSGEAEVARGAQAGDVTVNHMEGSFSGRVPLGEKTALAYGAGFSVNEIDAPAVLPLPDRLGELTLNLGVTHRFSQRWSGSAFVRPGFYSDLEDFSSDAFNVPLIAMANYVQSPDLVWIFGAGVNGFSDRVFMPIAGVRWKFAPEWTLNVGFPRLGVSWDANKQLSVFAGASVQGGSYRITENLGVPAAGVNRLANTYVSYREIRLGAGTKWAVTEKVSVSVEAGVMTDRRFEFFDRNYTLNGEAAPYVSISVDGRF
jgi:hypothetical protein